MIANSHHILSTEELSTLMKLEHLISRVSKKSSWWLPVSDQHGLNPVKVIYGIKWGCFLLGIWHLSVEKQSFVVSWLNLSFQGDPKGLLKSWWFGIMRFPIVACPQRLHSNALPAFSGLKNLTRENQSCLWSEKLNLHMAFEWERYIYIWGSCILEHIYSIVLDTILGSLAIALC